MKRCKNCLMVDTKPGIILDDEGICQACRHAEMKKTTDYAARWKELEALCNKYRRDDGYYDCMIAVSGGKDSHFQVHIIKEVLGMNPLLVTAADWFSTTEAGKHNFRNLCDVFNCDIMKLNISPNLERRMSRISFEAMGCPTWAYDRIIYCFPIRTAINMKIPLIFYGENVSWEYGGVQNEETYSAREQINNDVVKPVNWDMWYKNGITDKELNMIKYPTVEEITEAKLDPAYLSYFIPWNGERNYEVAKRYGFRDLAHEWKREGFLEDYDQIDSIGYLIDCWMKYPKMAFSRATDVVGYWIRSGKITREEGARLIREHDHKVDRRALDDYLAFAGYTHKEFWDVIEKLWNRDLFEKTDGLWKVKDDGLDFVFEEENALQGVRK